MADKSTTKGSRKPATGQPGVSEVHRRAREAIEALKAARDDLNRHARELEDQREVNQAERERIDQDRSDLQGERTKFEADREGHESRLTQREKAIVGREEKVSSLESKLAALELTLKDEVATVSQRERALEDERAEARRESVEAISVSTAAAPQSAGTNGSGSTRKLRRNTKRKAIGV